MADRSVSLESETNENQNVVKPKVKNEHKTTKLSMPEKLWLYH